jgi:predicted Na+-dependent transporter
VGGENPLVASLHARLPLRLLISLMIFHQMQLMACATLAQRYVARDTPPSGTAAS